MGSKKFAFINRVAGAANRIGGGASPTRIALKTAEKIDKQVFLEELTVQWWDHVGANADVEEELDKAQKRIDASNYREVFNRVTTLDPETNETITSPVTDSDLRSVIQWIIDHKNTVKYDKPKTSRNEPCPCGSGKKYKKCCWLQGGFFEGEVSTLLGVGFLLLCGLVAGLVIYFTAIKYAPPTCEEAPIKIEADGGPFYCTEYELLEGSIVLDEYWRRGNFREGRLVLDEGSIEFRDCD